MSRHTLVLAVPAWLLMAAGWAAPTLAQQPGDKVDAKLASGDVIRGDLVSDDGKTVVISHPILGQLKLARQSVSGMTVVPPPPPGAAPIAPPPPSAPTPPTPPPEAPKAPEVKQDPDSFFKGWASTISFGLNGSDGNSENFSARGEFTSKRETSKTDTTFDIWYTYSTSDSKENTNKGEVSLRNDWKLGGPWRYYVIGKGEYDSFQDWEWRASIFTGFGYEFIKTDNTLLLGRVGVGFTKEFGSSNNRIDPALDLGIDWEHKFDARSKIFASFDYYPSLLNFSDYRATAKAGYEIIVDPEHKLSLKLGAQDDYDITPGPGRKKNDITYFATLGFSF